MAAVLAVIGVGAWLIVDTDDTSDEPRAVVRAFMDSAHAGDVEALEQTVAPDVMYTWLWRDEMVIDPIVGAGVPEYFGSIQHELGPGPAFERLGEPVAISEFQVVVPNHVEPNEYDGVMLHTLKQHDGELRITEIYWIPEQEGVWQGG